MKLLCAKLLAAGLLATLAANLFAADLPAPERVGTLDESIAESSGLVPSPKHAGLFWTFGDSGNPPTLYAVDNKGALKAKLEIPGAKNEDWESMAVDEQGRLIIGDTGDNNRQRAELRLMRLQEPDDLAKPGLKKEDVQTFQLHYPKDVGPQDTEALLVRAGFAYVFTKERKRVRCFRAPLGEAPPEAPLELEFVAETDQITLVTDASLTPDGKHLALLTYTKILVLDLPAAFEATAAEKDGKPKPFEGTARARSILLGFGDQGQCEGLCWDGADLLISNEGRPLWRMKGILKP